MKRLSTISIFVIITVLTFGVFTAYAQLQSQPETIQNSDKILENLHSTMMTHIVSFAKLVKKYAIQLFFLLAGINLVWKIIMQLIEGAELQKTVAEVTKFLIMTSIFYYLLDNGLPIMESFVNSFLNIAYEGTGLTRSELTVEGILSLGVKIVTYTLKNFSLWGGESIVMFILSLLIYIILLLITANYIIEYTAVWFVVYIGYFVLAFGGSEFTREMSIAYIKAIVGAGMRLFAIIFMVGFAIKILNQTVTSATTPQELFYIFTISLLLLLLMQKIPDVVASLVSSAWGHMSGVSVGTALTGAGIGWKLGQGATGKIGLPSVSGFISGLKGGGSDSAGSGNKDIPNNASSSETSQNSDNKSNKPNPYKEKGLIARASYASGKLAGMGVRGVASGISKLASSSESPFNKSEELSKKNDTKDSNTTNVTNKTESNIKNSQTSQTPKQEGKKETKK